MMKTKYITAKRIVVSEKTNNAENLLTNNELQPRFVWEGFTEIKKSGYVLLDFGKELRGGVRVTIQAVSQSPAKYRIVFGESVMEALSHIGYKSASNDHATRDMIINAPEMSSECHGSTGFRFVKIEAVDADLTISTVKAASEIKDIEYKGSFECSDELLNRIWQVGAYTVHLNMNEYVWDGIKRDRLVWIGDLNPEIATIKAVFGYDESVENSLDIIKRDTPSSKWMNNIPSYSMWWIINHYDWFMQNGNIKYLKEQAEYIKELVENGVNWLKSIKPKEFKFDYFIDWSNAENTENSIYGLFAVFYKAFICAGKIFKYLDDGVWSNKCFEYAKYLKENTPKNVASKTAAALGAYSGIKDAKEINNKILSVSEYSGLSPFLGYYIISARAMAGDMIGSLNVIRKFWGAILKMGATTFWEDFDLDWLENSAPIDIVTPDGMNDIHGDFGKHCYTQFRHSLCHGWAGGPTAFLSEWVLGIKIIEPGCKKIKIEPNLGDLEYAKGTYPTPYGNICIDHLNCKSKIETIVTAPSEIEIVR